LICILFFFQLELSPDMTYEVCRMVNLIARLKKLQAIILVSHEDSDSDSDSDSFHSYDDSPESALGDHILATTTVTMFGHSKITH
jgi:muramoyltetrapeptide carboxypeptidase LdcA involved in peptidoglycan recycling